MKKYPKVRAVGHREIEHLFDGPVVIQEKIDGSNFGFGLVDGQLCCVSRTQDLCLGSPEILFAPAIEYLKRIKNLIPAGYFFRCEFLAKPKHNVLTYSRIPQNHLVLFDIERIVDGLLSFCDSRELLLRISERLGIEPAREIWRGPTSHDVARDNFERHWSKDESILGGVEMEGVVIKNYNHYTNGGSPLLGKWVRDEFKEVHRHQSLADRTDPIDLIGARFGGPARWQKAVQRLQETGECTNSPEDIGKLISLTRQDVVMECLDEIKEALWQHYKRNIVGGSTKGLAEWYKSKL